MQATQILISNLEMIVRAKNKTPKSGVFIYIF